MSEMRSRRWKVGPALYGIALLASPVEVGAEVVVAILDVVFDDDLRVPVLIQVQQLDAAG